MVNVLSFNTTKQNVWFTSDWHWNHNPSWDKPIWAMRGFKNVKDSNEYLIREINKLVKDNDILFNLGDLALNCNETDFLFLLNSIRCQNIFALWGNHPNPMRKIYKREIKDFITSNRLNLSYDTEIYPWRYKNLVYLGDTAQITVDNQFINLSHFPYRIYDLMHKQGWALAGHSHLSDKERHPAFPYHKALDVGWDFKLAPWSFSEIKLIMDKKEIVKLDHHDYNTT